MLRVATVEHTFTSPLSSESSVSCLHSYLNTLASHAQTVSKSHTLAIICKGPFFLCFSTYSHHLSRLDLMLIEFVALQMLSHLSRHCFSTGADAAAAKPAHVILVGHGDQPAGGGGVSAQVHVRRRTEPPAGAEEVTIDGT